MTVAGLLLAAGAGRRFGTPKALVTVAGEPLVRRGVRTLRDGGCQPVTVVLGAAAERVAPLVPPGVATVTADDWAEGMGASLRAGLAALEPGPTAVLVHLVDLPGVDARVIAALLADAAPATVRRPTYDGVPGHPVLFGADHLADVAATLHGDSGARAWLAAHRAAIETVECGQFGSGFDVDTPQALRDGFNLGLWN